LKLLNKIAPFPLQSTDVLLHLLYIGVTCTLLGTLEWLVPCKNERQVMINPFSLRDLKPL
jgi:hypothetical protein